VLTLLNPIPYILKLTIFSPCKEAMKAVEKLDRLLDPRLKVLQDRKTKRDPWVVGNLSNFEEKRSTKV
jgi:hypothetical protein